MQTTEMKPVQAGAKKRLGRLIVALVVAALTVAGLGAAVANAQPMGTLMGKITEPGGAPLAAGSDVRVQARFGDGVGGGGWVEPDGRFTIPGLYDGWTLRHLGIEDATGTYRASEWIGIDPVTIEDGETIDVGSIEITRAAAITGKITGPDGAPLNPGAQLEVTAYSGAVSSNEEDRGWLGVTREVDAATGAFEIRGLPTESVRNLEFRDSAGIYPTQLGHVDVELVPGVTQRLGSFPLVLGGRITGKLTGPGGTPLSDRVGIRAFALDANGNEVGDGEYDSDGYRNSVDLVSGEFAINGVPAGSVKTLRFRPDYDSTYSTTDVVVSVQVAAGGTSPAGTFKMSPASPSEKSGTITGKVTGPGGDPLDARARVSVTASDEAGEEIDDISVQASGDFSMDVWSGRPIKSLHFYDAGANRGNGLYAPLTVQVGDNPGPGEVKSVGPFALQLGGSLTGSLTRVGGAPLDLPDQDYVFAAAAGIDGNEIADGYVNRITGEFKIDQLPTGQITKLRFHTGFDEQRSFSDREYDVDFNITPGVTTQSGRFELPPAGKLTGTLVGPNGTVPANATCLSVDATGSDGYSYDGSISGQVAAGTGRFAVGGLSVKPVKSLTVNDTCNGGIEYGHIELGLTLAAGEAKDLGQVKLVATGRLTGKGTGPGGSGLNNDSRVHVVAYDGEGRQVGKTAEADRATGTFTITEVPGTIVKRIGFYDTGWKGSYSPQQRDVSITVAPDTAVDAGSFELALHTGEIAKPGKPHSPSVYERHQSVELYLDSWDTDDGGAGITDWIIQYSADRGTNWTTFDDGVSPDSSVVVTGLSNGTPYVFRVAAKNSVGQGDWSEASEPVTPAAQRPGKPSAPTGTAGNGQVSLSWSAPADNGGAPITDYRIYYWRVGDETREVFDDGVSAATSATVTGLSNGVGYRFAIEAINSAGRSWWSGDSSGSVTPVAPPPPPAPAPAPVVVDQHVAGGVPGQVKRKSRKPIALPTATDGGQRVGWSSATPKICKVVRGKLKLTGKKGVCRLTGVAAGTAQHRSLRQAYAIRVR